MTWGELLSLKKDSKIKCMTCGEEKTREQMSEWMFSGRRRENFLWQCLECAKWPELVSGKGFITGAEK